MTNESAQLPATLDGAIEAWLKNVKNSRSINTYDTYRKVMDYMCKFVFTAERRASPPAMIREEDMRCLIQACHEEHIDPVKKVKNKPLTYKPLSPTSERVYITALMGFLEYLASYDLPINLQKVNQIIKSTSKKPGKRIPHFPRQDIENVIDFALTLDQRPTDPKGKHSVETQRLINLRDKAFLLTLADTGLRVHEACKLLRSDLDQNEARAFIIGKGNKQAVVRFSTRSIEAIKAYLRARQVIDGTTGRALGKLPVFARHDYGAIDKGVYKALAISPTTGRDIVDQRVREALGRQPDEAITPHSFRHYFVTLILETTNNLHVAKNLARHESVTTTEGYSHMADSAMDAAFYEAIEKDNGRGCQGGVGPKLCP